MVNIYSRKEAAKYLGISLSTLDEAKNSGKIEYIQYVPNGCVFYTETALQAYIARSTHRAIPVNEIRSTYRNRRKY